MNKIWASIVNYYNTNATFHGLVAAVEGGAITGITLWFGMGMPINKQSLAALGSAVLGGIVTAVRNWLKNRPGQPAVPNQ